MLQEIVLAQRWQIQLDQSLFEDDLFVLAGHLLTVSAACPGCGFSSTKVHSHYTRQLADLPVSGQSVQIRLLVRRFFCLNPSVNAALLWSNYHFLWKSEPATLTGNTSFCKPGMPPSSQTVELPNHKE